MEETTANGETEVQLSELAAIAYNRYGATTDFKNFQGNPMPTLEELPPKIKAAWNAAAIGVEEEVEKRLHELLASGDVSGEERLQYRAFYEARIIHGHEVNEVNRQIVITADAQNPDNGNASHHYRILIGGSGVQFLHFQDGPVKDVGANGVTMEVLLAIIVDRIKGFQSSKFSCRENALALTKLEEAVHWLQHRTNERLTRGVEGTHAT